MNIPRYFYLRVKINEQSFKLYLEDASDEDVVEVVRCWRCIHYKEDGGICSCLSLDGLHPEHFCSCGVLKKEIDDE